MEKETFDKIRITGLKFQADRFGDMVLNFICANKPDASHLITVLKEHDFELIDFISENGNYCLSLGFNNGYTLNIATDKHQKQDFTHLNAAYGNNSDPTLLHSDFRLLRHPLPGKI